MIVDQLTEAVPFANSAAGEINKPTPSIWVVIPTFNAVAVTRKCLGDLSQQTHTNVRIVLVDSDSTDGTREMVSREFPAVTVVCGTSEWWWTKATNEGLRYVLKRAGRDDYVMTLNNDVIIPQEYLAEMIGLAEKYPGCVVGSANCDVADTSRIVDCGSYIDWRTMKYRSLSVNDFDEGGFSDKLNFLWGKGVLYPISVFRKHGLFDEVWLPHYGADHDFIASCKKWGYRIRIQKRVPLYSREDITAPRARDVKTIREKLMLLCIRKSNLNFSVHMRIMLRHCPKRYWLTGTVLLLGRLMGHIFIKKGVQRGPVMDS